MNGGPAVYDAEVLNNVLAVRVLECNQAKSINDVLMSLLAQNEVELAQNAQLRRVQDDAEAEPSLLTAPNTGPKVTKRGKARGQRIFLDT